MLDFSSLVSTSTCHFYLMRNPPSQVSFYIVIIYLYRNVITYGCILTHLTISVKYFK